MLIGGIVELGMLFFASVTLDNSMAAASREIRTGQVKSAATASNSQRDSNRIAFRNKVCARMGFLETNCISNLSVDARTIATFSAGSVPSPIQNGAFNPGALDFKTGEANSIVLVRGYYRWTMFWPGVNKALERIPGETIMTSATVFSNEPF
jgi:Flp pilus assembly protein TadG